MGEYGKPKQTMTVGERIVRTQFNPDTLDSVSQIKNKSAELIDFIYSVAKQLHDKADEAKEKSSSPITEEEWAEIRRTERVSSEVSRLIDLASTSFEEGAMWAVKAATTK